MKRKIRAFILIALVTTVVLAGCREKDNGDASTGRKKSNSVVVGISQDLDSLDPHNIAYAGTREVLFNLFEGLVKATSAGDIEPAVAKEFTVSEDATSILFEIRDGIKFWDGSAVTVEDVVFSVERYADIQGEESAFSVFESAEAVGDNQVKINLKEANTEFIYELTCAIIPKSFEAAKGNCPQGTGPFKFVSYTPGEAMEVVKNENYRKKGQPYLDSVTFKIVADTDTAVLQLNSGAIDIYQYLTADQTAVLKTDKFNIEVGNVNYVQGMFLNNKAKPFDNVKVRQAVYHAVDRQLINDMIFDGKSHIIGTNMIPASTKYYNAETESRYDYNEETARKLLAEAGYPDGFEFTITVPNNYAPHESTAQIVADCLQKVGIKANISLVEFTTWFSEVYVGRNYEATVVAVDGTLAPRSWMAKNISTAPDNFTNYSNPEFDKVSAQALAETDLDKKVDYYRQLQEILAEDAASIYIQDPSNLVAVNSKLEGYVFYPISAQDMSVVKYK
ncbi:MAG: ABC transporter substrate-binding protein [Lachnospiraceae bacterium]